MKCFYHVDNDGKCAGFWVKHYAPRDQYPTEFIKINYGIHFPIEKIKQDEQVYIVDFSITPSEMRELLRKTTNVTWIDHHVTEFEKYKDFETPIRGVRMNGVAGCMLTYCWFRYMTNKGKGDPVPFESWMTEMAPAFTKLIADMDVWTFKYGNTTREFSFGFSMYDNEPEDDIWEEMCVQGSYTTQQIIREGKLIRKYQEKTAESYCIGVGYELEFEGLKCYVINRGRIGSDFFAAVNDGTYDMFVGFVYEGDIWRYSLRAAKENIDVSKIAKKYGGGGHKGAAGFELKEFILNEE